MFELRPLLSAEKGGARLGRDQLGVVESSIIKRRGLLALVIKTRGLIVIVIKGRGLSLIVIKEASRAAAWHHGGAEEESRSQWLPLHTLLQQEEADRRTQEREWLH